MISGGEQRRSYSDDNRINIREDPIEGKEEEEQTDYIDARDALHDVTLAKIRYNIQCTELVVSPRTTAYLPRRFYFVQRFAMS